MASVEQKPIVSLRIAALACLFFFGTGSLYFFGQHSPETNVRQLLAEMSHQPGGNIDLGFTGRMYYEVQADFDRLGRSAVPELIRALDDPSSSIRRLAAGQLGRLGDQRAVVPLIALLADEEFIVQYWAAQALGQIGDPRAIKPLTSLLLNSHDDGLRQRAADALDNIDYLKRLPP